MKKLLSTGFILLGLCGHAWSGLAIELVCDDLARPVWIGSPAQEKENLWIAEQDGKIWKVSLEKKEPSKQLWIDLSAQVARKHNEQGLLGVAFAPDFVKTGRFYVNYTDTKGDTCIVRYVSKDGEKVDEKSGEMLLHIDQPYGNHNAGWLDFGKDGYLYITMGDGGNSYDPENRAQDLTTHLGKILRIDVSGDKGYVVPSTNYFANEKNALPEIHAIGLRNPWRCSFDRETGDLWIGDVGQDKWEEINFVKKAEVGGLNFGWRLRQGDTKTPKVGGQIPENYCAPVYVYPRGSENEQGRSVTGGFVYRGNKIPELQGRYVFGDFQNRRIWSLTLKDGKTSDFKDHSDELKPKEGGVIQLLSTFGEDAEGEIYLADLMGKVYRIIDQTLP